MGSKVSGLGGAIIGAALATAVAAFVAKEAPTGEDIDTLYAARQMQLTITGQAVLDQDPSILDALPKHDGRLIGCAPEVAELGAPADVAYRVSYYRCRWLTDDGTEDSQWLTDEEETRARDALKDDRKRPELVRVATPPEPAKDPHPRDLSVPVYGSK